MTASGALASLAGGAILCWAVLADRLRTRLLRKRGELRRCPRCWYDMAAVAGLRCPECGCQAKREQALRRSRRRWRFALTGATLVLVSAASLLYSRGRADVWRTWLPNMALILLVPHTDTDWPSLQLVGRLEVPETSQRTRVHERLYEWQWRLLADRCSEDVARHGFPRARASVLLLCAAPDEVSFERLLEFLDHREQGVRYWGAQGLADLADQLPPAALEQARGDILQLARREPEWVQETRELQARILESELARR